MTVPSGEPPAGRARFALGRDDFVRIGSALVLAPLAIGTAYAGGWPFTLFWGIAALGVLAEWFLLVDRARAYRCLLPGAAALVAATALVGVHRVAPALLAIALGTAGAVLLATPERRAWDGAGVLYAGALLSAPVLLRADADWGFVAILFLFAIVWTTDIGAYFGGRILQGPKLWRRVSPNKTWSGAVTGTAAAVGAAMLVAKIGGAEHVWPLALLAAGLSAVGQLGDLFESWVKRRFGAKDASHLIPGHGGIMDRVDAFVAASAAAALLACLRGGLAGPAHGLLLW